MRNKFLWLALLWCIFITYMCLTSGDNIPKVSWLNIPHKDKIVHFVFYFVFAFLLNLGFKEKYGNIKKAGGLAFSIAVAYGMLVELFQGLITADRSPELLDVLANTTGTAAAIFALWLFQKRQ